MVSNWMWRLPAGCRLMKGLEIRMDSSTFHLNMLPVTGLGWFKVREACESPDLAVLGVHWTCAVERASERASEGSLLRLPYAACQCWPDVRLACELWVPRTLKYVVVLIFK